MKHVGKFFLQVILGLGLFAIVLPVNQSGGPFKVLAHDRCRSVRGTINSVFTTQNCNSPVGLCTTGTISGARLLDGNTSFVAMGVAPSAGMPGIEPTANLSYSGQLTIVARQGTLVINDLGVLDAAHLAFTEMERPSSGTGVFANPGNNAFFISGAIVDNGQGFQGDLSGIACFDGQ
ncbi:MAG: hypothetical protein WBE44_05240 [Terriglobales bacterium]|jgi:hypothetical protein